MKQYLDLLSNIIENGDVKDSARDNMPGTRQLFCEMMTFDLQRGFPLVTTKRMFTRGVFEELFWFLRGDVNNKSLLEKKVNIWNEDVYKFYVKNLPHGAEVKGFEQWVADYETADPMDYNGGTLYGQLWRNFGYFKIPVDAEHDIVIEGVDQIKNVVNDIISNPNGRYKIVSAWNPQIVNVGGSALPSCHMLFQLNVRKGEFLDLGIVQRSCDMPLGVPFNVASYALLIHIFAIMTGLKPGVLKWIGMDCHIYENQLETADIQIAREPKGLPHLYLELSDLQNDLIGLSLKEKSWDSNRINEFFQSLEFENVKLDGYEPHSKLDYPLSTGLVK